MTVRCVGIVPIVIICLLGSACAKNKYQMTMRSAGGGTVVCKPPAHAPDLTEHGRVVAVVEWCSLACQEHGYKWIGKQYESGVLENDFDLGTAERIAVGRFIPRQCLPFDPPRMGIVSLKDGAPLKCLGGVLKAGCE